MRAICCAQQCCDMTLRWNVAIVWPGQESITRSVTLPYSVCETAFSQVGLFLDKPFPRISSQKPIRSERIINNKLLMPNYWWQLIRIKKAREKNPKRRFNRTSSPRPVWKWLKTVWPHREPSHMFRIIFFFLNKRLIYFYRACFVFCGDHFEFFYSWSASARSGTKITET